MTENETARRITIQRKKLAQVRHYARLLSFIIGVAAFSLILAFGYENTINLNPMFMLMMAGVILGIAFMVAIVFSFIVRYLTKRELEKIEEWEVSLD
jgi:putative flippase GtrA